MEKEDKNKQIDEIIKKLERGVTELFESEKYKDYLRIMAKFYHYSFNNCLLIALQCPEASRVAGYQAWKIKFDRHVKQGEKGIQIIAPAPCKIKEEVAIIDETTKLPIRDAEGNVITEMKERVVPRYKVTTVFDVSQTEGKELPEICHELTGEVEQYKEFFAAIKEVSPVPISFEEIPGTAKGYYHQVEKRIAIREGMSEMQSIKTLVHEIAHALLHDQDEVPKEEQVNTQTKEVEAESVAYAVCQHYGIETSDNSFGYVAGWSGGKDLEELKKSMERISSTTKVIIEQIEAILARKHERVEEYALERKNANLGEFEANHKEKERNASKRRKR